MVQQVKYPLPPLFLTEVLERAVEDHRHKCDTFCDEDDFTRGLCERHRLEDVDLLDNPYIVSIQAGHGRHIHDDPDDENGCNYSDYEVMVEGRWVVERRRKTFGCMNHCDDSDWIVEVCYNRRGYHAVYGIKRAGDVQDVSLWMD